MEKRNQGEKLELLAHVWETVGVNADLFKQRSEGQVFNYKICHSSEAWHIRRSYKWLTCTSTELAHTLLCLQNPRKQERHSLF